MAKKTAALTFDTATLKAGFQASLANLVGTESQLAAGDLTRLQSLSDQLWPLIEQETKQAVAGTERAEIVQQYIDGLMATLSAEAGGAATAAILANKRLLAQEVNRWISIGATWVTALAKAAIPVAIAAI